MIKAAVLGATGYAGIELVRLLTSHPEVSIEILGSHSFAGQKISDVYKNFNHVLEKECEELDLDKVGACDVAFTALPHGASKSVIPSLRISLKIRIISICLIRRPATVKYLRRSSVYRRSSFHMLRSREPARDYYFTAVR